MYICVPWYFCVYPGTSVCTLVLLCVPWYFCVYPGVHFYMCKTQPISLALFLKCIPSSISYFLECWMMSIKRSGSWSLAMSLAMLSKSCPNMAICLMKRYPSVLCIYRCTYTVNLKEVGTLIPLYMGYMMLVTCLCNPCPSGSICTSMMHVPQCSNDMSRTFSNLSKKEGGEKNK